jgi:hypothetical protein
MTGHSKVLENIFDVVTSVGVTWVLADWDDVRTYFTGGMRQSSTIPNISPSNLVSQDQPS